MTIISNQYKKAFAVFYKPNYRHDGTYALSCVYIATSETLSVDFLLKFWRYIFPWLTVN